MAVRDPARSESAGPAPPAAPDQPVRTHKTARRTGYDGSSRGRVWLASITALGTIAMLAIGGARWLRASTRAPQVAVAEYFAEVDRGDYSGARSLLCARDRQRLDSATFEASVAPFAGRITRVETHALDPLGAARSVAVTVWFDAGDPYELTATATRESTGWKVCDLFG
jgi:hypothetical protein